MTIKVKKLLELLKDCDPESDVALRVGFWNCNDGCSGFDDEIITDSSHNITVNGAYASDDGIVTLIEADW